MLQLLHDIQLLYRLATKTLHLLNSKNYVQFHGEIVNIK